MASKDFREYQERCLREQLESIRTRCAEMSTEDIRHGLRHALRKAAALLPRLHAGEVGGDVDYTVRNTDATWREWDTELHHREFEDALSAEDFSHVTHRSWCGRDMLYAYRKDATSPTQCLLRTSIEETDRTRAILAKHQKHATLGGQRGEMACRRAIRGD